MENSKGTKAQVHRFHEKVAIYVGKGETVYLNPQAAKALGNALVRAAKSVEKETFAQHTFGTFNLLITE